MDERRKMMRRLEQSNHARFLTFSCYNQLPLFEENWVKDIFVDCLSTQREKCGFHLLAWVVMPEHVHLLLWPKLPEFPVSKVLWGLKRDVARRAVSGFRDRKSTMLSQILNAKGQNQFWQRGGGHDRNIFSIEELEEKIGYINLNPARRGLVERAEDWAWSSARWYAGGRETGLSIDPICRPE